MTKTKRLLRGVGMMFILVLLAACAARENPPGWGIPTHDVNSGEIAKDTRSIADSARSIVNELTMLRSDFAQLGKVIKTANQKKSATVTAGNGEQVTDLSLVKGVLLVLDPKDWNPEKPNTCVSPHYAPIRSTMEGGPKGTDFAHKLLEGRCLAPGTTPFNVEPVSNGFFGTSIAVRNVGAFAYNLQQKLAFPVIGRTTSGASVLRVYIKQTSSLVRWMPDMSPVVAVNPFTSRADRNKFERGEYYRRMGIPNPKVKHRVKTGSPQSRRPVKAAPPVSLKMPLESKPKASTRNNPPKRKMKEMGKRSNSLALRANGAGASYRLATFHFGKSKILDVEWGGPTVSLPPQRRVVAGLSLKP